MYVGIMQEEHADDYYTHYCYYSMFLPCSAAVLPRLTAKFTKCFAFFFCKEASHQRLEEAKKQAIGFSPKVGSL